jgi:hypothetical protein
MRARYRLGRARHACDLVQPDVAREHAARDSISLTATLRRHWISFGCDGRVQPGRWTGHGAGSTLRMIR